MRYISLFTILLMMCSCYHVNQKYVDQYLVNYRDIVRRQINFPIPKLSNVNKHFQANGEKRPTILMIVGTDCSSCIEKFKAWQAFITKGNFNKTNVVFVALGENNEYFEYHVNKHGNFDFQILLDPSGKFMDNNGLVPYVSNAFLLDKNNKIVMIGDPIANPAIKNFYDYEIDELSR